MNTYEQRAHNTKARKRAAGVYERQAEVKQAYKLYFADSAAFRRGERTMPSPEQYVAGNVATAYAKSRFSELATK